VLLHEAVVHGPRVPGDGLAALRRPGLLLQEVVGEGQHVAAAAAREDVCQVVGVELVVAVEVGDPRAAGLAQGGVAGGRDTAVGRPAQHPQPRLLGGEPVQ
jgi:hypothetical protein